MKSVLRLYFGLLMVMSAASFGATVAHWDFSDAGAADQALMPGNASREADISGNGTIGPEDFLVGSADLSGNGNHLAAWNSSWMKWTATSFQGDFAMEATNDWPDSRTDSHWSQPAGIDVEMITPREWTVECVFQATAGTNRTMVGRIGYQLPGASNQSVAAFYLAERSNQRINCEYVDKTGIHHNAMSANGTLVAGTWYHVAAVSDGTTLSLYLKNLDADTDYQVVATADLSASTDPSIIRDEYIAGSFATNGGSWTVGCGTYNNGTTDRFVSPGKIDMVAISDAVLAPGSFVAEGGQITDPYPATGQVQVELTPTLQWNGLADADDENRLDPNVLAHYVYIDLDNTDEDPNLYYQGEVGVSGWDSRAASYGPLSLTYDQNISWQIEEGLDDGSGAAYAPGDPNNVRGAVWRFTTLKSIPVVSTDQPLSLRVFPTETVSFTVDFSSISTPTVKWYKDDNVTVTEITAGITTQDNGGGSYTTTLDLATPVDSSDEGQYYCAVTNDGTTYYNSGIADLVVKRQLSQYQFDGDLEDSSANGAPAGTALDTQGDPNSLNAVPAAVDYVTGADGVAGSALYLEANEYVDFGVEGYPRAGAATSNGYGGGLDEGTIVFWVKPNVADVFQTILGNFNDGGTTGFLGAVQADQDLDLYIRGADGATLANHPAARPDRPEFNLADGNWHLMAACWNGNTSTLYVDGQWVVNNTGGTPASYNAWQYGVLLGGTRTSANRNVLSDMFGGGAVDNLRIYNYRLDADGVEAFAQEYQDNTGIIPCTNMSFEGNAYNYDNTGSSYCRVDLADLAVMASKWLNCGLYSCN